MMNTRILQQFERETQSWGRLLECIETENVHLKIRISEIAAHDISDDLLAEVDKFQTLFIEEDEVIARTRRDVAAFEELITKEYRQDGNIRKIFQVHKKMRTDIESLAQQFNKVKSEFNHCLAEKL
jgi:hypothetical protein